MNGSVEWVDADPWWSTEWRDPFFDHLCVHIGWIHSTPRCGDVRKIPTLPEAIPKRSWSSNHPFSGAMLVSGRVDHRQRRWRYPERIELRPKRARYFGVQGSLYTAKVVTCRFTERLGISSNLHCKNMKKRAKELCSIFAASIQHILLVLFSRGKGCESSHPFLICATPLLTWEVLEWGMFPLT